MELKRLEVFQQIPASSTQCEVFAGIGRKYPKRRDIRLQAQYRKPATRMGMSWWFTNKFNSISFGGGYPELVCYWEGHRFYWQQCNERYVFKNSVVRWQCRGFTGRHVLASWLICIMVAVLTNVDSLVCSTRGSTCVDSSSDSMKTTTHEKKNRFLTDVIDG